MTIHKNSVHVCMLEEWWLPKALICLDSELLRLSYCHENLAHTHQVTWQACDSSLVVPYRHMYKCIAVDWKLLALLIELMVYLVFPANFVRKTSKNAKLGDMSSELFALVFLNHLISCCILYFSEVSSVSSEAMQRQAISWSFPSSSSQQNILANCARNAASQDETRCSCSQPSQGIRGRTSSIWPSEENGRPSSIEGASTETRQEGEREISEVTILSMWLSP